jgi:hypothetical protein
LALRLEVDVTTPLDPGSPGSTRRRKPTPDPLPPSTPFSGAETGSSTSGAQDKAREVAGQAQDKTREAAGQARGRLTDQVNQRSTQAGQQVSGASGDVRSVAQELRNQGKDRPAQIADQVADRAERLGSYLERSDAERILRDVEDFGRRQPWVIVTGGLALGLLASRFLKASSRRRYETYQSSYRPPTRPLPSETYTGYTGTTPTGAGYAAAPVGEPLGPTAGSSRDLPPYSAEPLPPPVAPEARLPGDRPEDDPSRQGTAGTR